MIEPSYGIDRIILSVMSQGNYNQIPVLSGHGDIYGMLYDVELLKVFND